MPDGPRARVMDLTAEDESREDVQLRTCTPQSRRREMRANSSRTTAATTPTTTTTSSCSCQPASQPAGSSRRYAQCQQREHNAIEKRK